MWRGWDEAEVKISNILEIVARNRIKPESLPDEITVQLAGSICDHLEELKALGIIKPPGGETTNSGWARAALAHLLEVFSPDNPNTAIIVKALGKTKTYEIFYMSLWQLTDRDSAANALRGSRTIRQLSIPASNRLTPNELDAALAPKAYHDILGVYGKAGPTGPAHDEPSRWANTDNPPDDTPREEERGGPTASDGQTRGTSRTGETGETGETTNMANTSRDGLDQDDLDFLDEINDNIELAPQQQPGGDNPTPEGGDTNEHRRAAAAQTKRTSLF